MFAGRRSVLLSGIVDVRRQWNHAGVREADHRCVVHPCDDATNASIHGGEDTASPDFTDGITPALIRTTVVTIIVGRTGAGRLLDRDDHLDQQFHVTARD